MTFLDSGTLLVTAGPKAGWVDELLRYDLASRTTTKIIDVTSPGQPSGFGIAVTGGWIVSFTSEFESWGVPVSGGAARKLAVAPEPG